MDREDFETFVAAKGRELSRRAYLLSGDVDIARRVVGRTLTEAYGRRRELVDADELETWAAQHVERVRSRAYRRHGGIVPSPEAGGPEATLEEVALAAVLGELDRNRRAVLYARFGEDVPRVGPDMVEPVRAQVALLSGGALEVPSSAEWPAYDRLGDRVPNLLDAEQVFARSGRRQRIVLVAALVAAVAAAGWIGVTGIREPAGRTPEPRREPSVAAWLRAADAESRLPAPGTWLAVTCALDGHCDIGFRRADGTSRLLDDRNAALLKTMMTYELEGAAWSPDGAILGIRAFNGYELHNLATRAVSRLPSSDGPELWRPVGWVDPNGELLLSFEDRGTVTQIVRWRNGVVERIRMPAGITARPVALMRYSVSGRPDVQVVEPAEPDLAPSRRKPVQVLRLDVLGLGGNEHGLATGERRKGPVWDARDLLREGETLTGRDGLPQFHTTFAPGGRQKVATWLTVFAVRHERLEPVAALTKVGGRLVRLDSGDLGGEPVYYGPLDHGAILAGVSVGDREDPALLHSSAAGSVPIGQRTVAADLRERYLLPGMVMH